MAELVSFDSFVVALCIVFVIINFIVVSCSKNRSRLFFVYLVLVCVGAFMYGFGIGLLAPVVGICLAMFGCFGLVLYSLVV